ncbi:hypothetical protein GBA52_029018 [Prunus armeniaca]|nr:hypothetical protein GBA52_029018 [Prunus armeniaca]
MGVSRVNASFASDRGGLYAKMYGFRPVYHYEDKFTFFLRPKKQMISATMMAVRARQDLAADQNQTAPCKTLSLKAWKESRVLSLIRTRLDFSCLQHTLLPPLQNQRRDIDILEKRSNSRKTTKLQEERNPIKTRGF